MSGEMWRVDSEETLQHFVAFATARWRQGITYRIIHPNRSSKQNAALHALLRRLAAALNDAGFSLHHSFCPEFELPYTEVSVKRYLYHPIIKAMYDKESTADLTKEELSHSVEVMLARVAERSGVVIDGLEGAA